MLSWRARNRFFIFLPVSKKKALQGRKQGKSKDSTSFHEASSVWVLIFLTQSFLSFSQVLLAGLPTHGSTRNKFRNLSRHLRPCLSGLLIRPWHQKLSVLHPHSKHTVHFNNTIFSFVNGYWDETHLIAELLCVRMHKRNWWKTRNMELASGLIHWPENFLLYELSGVSGEHWNVV